MLPFCRGPALAAPVPDESGNSTLRFFGRDNLNLDRARNFAKGVFGLDLLATTKTAADDGNGPSQKIEGSTTAEDQHATLRIAAEFAVVGLARKTGWVCACAEERGWVLARKSDLVRPPGFSAVGKNFGGAGAPSGRKSVSRGFTVPVVHFRCASVVVQPCATRTTIAPPPAKTLEADFEVRSGLHKVFPALGNEQLCSDNNETKTVLVTLPPLWRAVRVATERGRIPVVGAAGAGTASENIAAVIGAGARRRKMDPSRVWRKPWVAVAEGERSLRIDPRSVLETLEKLLKSEAGGERRTGDVGVCGGGPASSVSVGGGASSSSGKREGEGSKVAQPQGGETSFMMSHLLIGVAQKAAGAKRRKIGM